MNGVIYLLAEQGEQSLATGTQTAGAEGWAVVVEIQEFQLYGEWGIAGWRWGVCDLDDGWEADVYTS